MNTEILNHYYNELWNLKDEIINKCKILKNFRCSESSYDDIEIMFEKVLRKSFNLGISSLKEVCENLDEVTVSIKKFEQKAKNDFDILAPKF
ncbi:MAG: hypothetical protein LBN03_02220 [Bifidobacteriaceae bacterium]|jgi:hypothetical protein|nr:hypothetical protein [Bifidobacteriaceae bacterium]